MGDIYDTGVDVLGRGHGGGHGHHGGHGGGRGRVPRGWWGGVWPWGVYDDDYDDVPDGYVIVDESHPIAKGCDLVGPDGECYVKSEKIEGFDSSVHSTTLRDSPVEDQVYGLQVAALKTGSPSLIQGSKDLQTALSSWWAAFSTSSIKEEAAKLGKAIASWTGKDPLDGPPIPGGVTSAMQEQLFDKGATGKFELAVEDTAASAKERATDVVNAAKSTKEYVENTAKTANTTLIIVAIAAGLGALAVTSTMLYKAAKR